MLFVEKCEQDTSYSTIFAPYEIMKKFWLLQGLAIPKHSYGIHIVELRFSILYIKSWPERGSNLRSCPYREQALTAEQYDQTMKRA